MLSAGLSGELGMGSGVESREGAITGEEAERWQDPARVLAATSEPIFDKTS